VVDLTRQELEALLWHVAVVDHAYGRDHPDDGASASAAAKLESEFAARREEHTARQGVSIDLPSVVHAQALALLLEHVDGFEEIRDAARRALERRERRAA